MVKHRLKVKKNVFLVENISSVLLSDLPPKFKDPGALTISFIIGENHIDRALLDLGESVNILPFSIYRQLDSRDLKTTKTTLQLTDEDTSKDCRGRDSPSGHFLLPSRFCHLGHRALLCLE